MVQRTGAGHIPNDLAASNVVVVYSAEAASLPITVTTCLNGNSLPSHTQGTNNSFPGQFANAVTLVIPDTYFHSGLNVITFGVARSAINTGIGLCYDIFGCFIPAPSPSVTVTPTNTPTPTFTFTPTPCPPLAHQILLQSFKQSDSNWNIVPMPDNNTALPGKTIGSIGCFLTCFSMIDGRDPHQLDDLFTGQGLISKKGDLKYIDAILLLHNILFNNLAVNQMASDPTLTFDLSTLIDSFAAAPNNQYVIGEIINLNTGGTHYVQVTGKTLNPITHQCDYSILDPAQRDFKFLSQYNNSSPYFLYALIGIKGF